MGFSDVQVLLKDQGQLEELGIDRCWYDYLDCKKKVYRQLMPHLVDQVLVSEANFVLRGGMDCGRQLGIFVDPGDICYIDYGKTYLNEMGYQHLGLVLKVVNNKALVVPLTSNVYQYEQAFDEIETPDGKRHLMRIGQPAGLKKPSVLFLNDIRFINTARIIETFGHIDENSKLFRQIQLRLMDILFQS